MGKVPRERHTARVALEAIKGEQALAEIGASSSNFGGGLKKGRDR